MTTTKVNNHVTIEHHNYCEQYTVKIDNHTHKVKKSYCRNITMDKKGIQEMVDRLIEKGMISLVGTDTTEILIIIWDIDRDGQLGIETHRRDIESDDYRSVETHKMLYNEFLN